MENKERRITVDVFVKPSGMLKITGANTEAFLNGIDVGSTMSSSDLRAWAENLKNEKRERVKIFFIGVGR